RAVGGARDLVPDDRRHPLPACRRRPGRARAGEGIDQGGDHRLRARAPGAGVGDGRAARRRRMTDTLARIARVAVVLSLLALVVVPSALAIRFTDDSYQVPTGTV